MKEEARTEDGVRAVSHTSEALLILAKSQDQLGEQIRDQRRTNEQLSSTLHQQSNALTRLSVEVAHLSETLKVQSELGVRVGRLEGEMSNFKFRIGLIIAVVVGIVQFGSRYLGSR